MLLVVCGLLVYTLFEPQRIEQSQAAQLQVDLDGAMSLYAENCAVCHGLDGSGVGAVPALNTPALRAADGTALEKIISRGLYGTAMPAWDQADNGPLSTYQISQLVSLIQQGNWQSTQDRVVNLGLAPLMPFTAEPDPEILAALLADPTLAGLAAGIQIYAENCVACHGPDGLGTSLAPVLNDPEVRARPLSDLERIVQLGSPGTLMAGWEKSLAPEELAAVLALITGWDRVPLGAVPAVQADLPVTAELLALGSDLYTANCSRCHGPEGQGTPRAPALNVKSFLEQTGDLAIEQIVALGVPGTAMPAWGDRLAQAEIQAVVGFLRTWEPTAPAVAAPARGGGPWWQTSANASTSARNGSPPWARQTAGTGIDPAQLASEIPVTPAATATPADTPSAVPQGSSGADTSSTSPPAGSPASYQPAVSSRQPAAVGSGGPAWAQVVDQPTSTWQALDPQARLLVGGLGGIALLAIFTALVALRRSG